MKWLSAGLTFVNFATVAGLFLGMASGGLGPWVAMFSLLIGVAAASAAYLTTTDKRIASPVPEPTPTTGTLFKGAQRRRQRTEQASELVRGTANYRYLWTWAVAGCFAIFAVRSFCWLLYIDGEDLRIQSPNNLVDLALQGGGSHGAFTWGVLDRLTATGCPPIDTYSYLVKNTGNVRLAGPVTVTARVIEEPGA